MELSVIVVTFVVIVHVSTQGWPQRKDLSQVNPMESHHQSRLVEYHEQRRRRLLGNYDYQRNQPSSRQNVKQSSPKTSTSKRQLLKKSRDLTRKRATGFATYLHQGVSQILDSTQEAKEKAKEAMGIMAELRETMTGIRAILKEIQRYIPNAWWDKKKTY